MLSRDGWSIGSVRDCPDDASAFWRRVKTVTSDQLCLWIHRVDADFRKLVTANSSNKARKAHQIEEDAAFHLLDVCGLFLQIMPVIDATLDGAAATKIRKQFDDG